MSIAGLLMRFAAIYIGLLVAIVVVFALIGTQPNSGVNAGALIGAVFGACLWFASRNKRYLTSTEKHGAIAGMWVIDIGLQLFVVWGTTATGGAQLSGGAVLFALVFIGLLHLAGIWFGVNFAGRQHARQEASKQGAAKAG